MFVKPDRFARPSSFSAHSPSFSAHPASFSAHPSPFSARTHSTERFYLLLHAHTTTDKQRYKIKGEGGAL